MFEVPPGSSLLKIIGYQQDAGPKVVLPKGVATYHTFHPIFITDFHPPPPFPMSREGMKGSGWILWQKAMQAPADERRTQQQ
jgi:hypothetical protein